MRVKTRVPWEEENSRGESEIDCCRLDDLRRVYGRRWLLSTFQGGDRRI